MADTDTRPVDREYLDLRLRAELAELEGRLDRRLATLTITLFAMFVPVVATLVIVIVQ